MFFSIIEDKEKLVGKTCMILVFLTSLYDNNCHLSYQSLEMANKSVSMVLPALVLVLTRNSRIDWVWTVAGLGQKVQGCQIQICIYKLFFFN